MSQTSLLPFHKVLMDGIQEMVFIIKVRYNSVFYYDFINRSAMEGTGLTQNVLGKSIHEVYSEVKANFLHEQYKKVVDTLEPFTYENSSLSFQGKRNYFKITLTPLIDKRKQCSHIVALVQDITKKKQAEFNVNEYVKKLNENEQRFRSLFHYNLDAIFSLDLTGRILNGNKAVESVTGYTSKELIGTAFIELIVTENVDSIKKYFQQVLAGTIETNRTAMINKQGERIEISVKFTPIKVNNRVLGGICYFKKYY